jgi:hypothetical protein
MSLIDLCRIEKKNTLPEIPLLEEPVIFEEQSQGWLKCNKSEMVTKENTQEKGGLDFGEIHCSPGGYIEMIDDTYKKLRLRAKENTVNTSKGTCSMATSSAWKANSSGLEATSESVMATTTPVQATTQSPASTAVPPSSPMLPKEAAKRTATPVASPLVTTSASKKATPSPSISVDKKVNSIVNRNDHHAINEASHFSSSKTGKSSS